MLIDTDVGRPPPFHCKDWAIAVVSLAFRYRVTAIQQPTFINLPLTLHVSGPVDMDGGVMAAAPVAVQIRCTFSDGQLEMVFPSGGHPRGGFRRRRSGNHSVPSQATASPASTCGTRPRAPQTCRRMNVKAMCAAALALHRDPCGKPWRFAGNVSYSQCAKLGTAPSVQPFCAVPDDAPEARCQFPRRSRASSRQALARSDSHRIRNTR